MTGAGRGHSRPHNRLPGLLRRTIYLTVAVMLISGIGWLVVAYLLAAADEPRPAPHPLAATLLMAHGIAAYAGLAAAALVGHVHIRVGWRTAHMRLPGVLLIVAFVVLAVTGLEFYYSANERIVEVARWTHVALGIALPAFLWLHIASGRRALR